jgi:hypothetical protein
MSDLPKTIKRWCCSPKKSCGNTTLYLVDNDSPAGWPPLYDYVRGNENSYTGGWKTEEDLWEWLDETKDHIRAESE